MTSAWVAVICGVFLSGVQFSVGGKIDHNALLIVAPLIAAKAVGRGPTEGENSGDGSWPVALMAVLVGFSLFTSGFFKGSTGWLSFEDSSVQALLVRNVSLYGRDAFLAPFAVGVHEPWLWEAADVGTVLLELSFWFDPLHPRLMRLAVRAMVVLHIAILLLMNIAFSDNLVVYALFLPWADGPLRLTASIQRRASAVPVWLLIVLGSVLAVLSVCFGNAFNMLANVIGTLWAETGLFLGLVVLLVAGTARPRRFPD